MIDTCDECFEPARHKMDVLPIIARSLLKNHDRKADTELKWCERCRGEWQHYWLYDWRVNDGRG